MDNTLLMVVIPLIGYLIAYHTYGRFLGSKIFELNDQAVCPSAEMEDGVDYVPTKKGVLFGHHFTTIAGLGPIVGPALGVFWGWLPALIWVFFGSIFMGAVHDFGSLVVSLRNKGQSVGDVAVKLIGPRTSILFQIIIFLALLIVIAIFALVIAGLFIKNPGTVLPVWLQIPIAVVFGWAMYKKNLNAVLGGVIALILMYATIWWGSTCGISLPDEFLGMNPLVMWMIVLLGYVFIASTIPVQVLLQPRDYINSYQLIVAMGLIVLGVIVANPTITAPAVNPAASAEGILSMYPFLFVVIACGAMSGFHSLAASGTTSKQCASETDARPIGYGGMLLEALLATLVIACVAGGLGMDANGGLATDVAYNSHYGEWGGGRALAQKLEPFILGATNMIEELGLSREFVMTILGVFLVSFAATTLDSATRIQRYVVAEFATQMKMKPLANKYVATGIAVFTAFLLAFHDGAGKGGLVLWPLFGCVNQLLGGLALLVITLYLARTKKPIYFTLIPMAFMMAMTTWALYATLNGFIGDDGVKEGKWVPLIVGGLVLVLQVWMVIEGIIALKKTLNGEMDDNDDAESQIGENMPKGGCGC